MSFFVFLHTQLSKIFLYAPPGVFGDERLDQAPWLLLVFHIGVDPGGKIGVLEGLWRETQKPGSRSGSPESTPPLGAAYDVVAVVDVEVIMIRNVMSVHLRVHEVVMTISGFFVQRLR